MKKVLVFLSFWKVLVFWSLKKFRSLQQWICFAETVETSFEQNTLIKCKSNSCLNHYVLCIRSGPSMGIRLLQFRFRQWYNFVNHFCRMCQAVVNHQHSICWLSDLKEYSELVVSVELEEGMLVMILIWYHQKVGNKPKDLTKFRFQFVEYMKIKIKIVTLHMDFWSNHTGSGVDSFDRRAINSASGINYRYSDIEVYRCTILVFPPLLYMDCHILIRWKIQINTV